jgi:phosphatidate cytidylyltransferase
MLKHRILSGCLIVAFLLCAGFYMPPIGVWLLLLTISSFGQFEFYHMVNSGGIPAFRIVGLLSGAALISATFWTVGPDAAHAARARDWESLVLLVSLIVVCVRQFPQKFNDKPLATIGCTLLGIWYVPFLFNYHTRLVFDWDGPRCAMTVGRTGFLLAMYLIVVVKITDIGAFFTGMAIGRHKLFPRISPAKTWEGFFGGIATAVVASLVFQYAVHGSIGMIVFHRHDAVVLGVILALAAVAGDLFESLLKRATAMKDSSAVVPGMGGVLDVIDSLLFGAPVLYYYVRFILL